MRLRDYFLVFRRYWWLPVLLALLGTAAAFGFSKWQGAVAPLYRSSIVLRVNTSRPDYGLNLAAENLLRNMTYIVNEDMYQRINDTLKLDMGKDKIASLIHIHPISEDLVIQVDVEDSDPNRARDIARVLGDQFVERQQINNANIDPNNRINVEVWNPPRPGTQIRPATAQNTIAGGILGLLLGIVLAFVLEFLDDTLHGAEDVERVIGLPIVGTIPVAAPQTRRRFSPRLAGVTGILLVLLAVGLVVAGFVFSGRLA